MLKNNVFIVSDYDDAVRQARENHHGDGLCSLIGNDWCYIDSHKKIFGNRCQSHIFYYIHKSVSSEILAIYGYSK